jgi:hypothetical protein
MAALITTLIDKQDNFEVVRDRLAEILLVESAAQQVLALDAVPTPKDPDLWKLRVFTEATNPWDQFVPNDAPGTMPEFTVPIVNVWFDQHAIDTSKSDPVKRQVYNGTFHVDCYGYGVSVDEDTGHTPGDKSAVLEAQRAARLVRNILMASQYFVLGLPRKEQQFVWGRRVQSVQAFQPPMDQHPGVHVAGVRLVVQVDYNEFAPEYQPENLEILNIQIRRTDEGEVFLEYQVNV